MVTVTPPSLSAETTGAFGFTSNITGNSTERPLIPCGLLKSATTVYVAFPTTDELGALLPFHEKFIPLGKLFLVDVLT